MEKESMEKESMEEKKNRGEERHQGIVAKIMNKQALVLLEGQEVPCLLAGIWEDGREAAAVGDFVVVEQVAKQQYRIAEILPRRTILGRGNRRQQVEPGGNRKRGYKQPPDDPPPDKPQSNRRPPDKRQSDKKQSDKRHQTDRGYLAEEIRIAVNGDCLLAVVTADYLLHQAGFPEMAALAAKRSGMEFGLFISKWDLAGESVRKHVLEKMELYRTPGAFVLAGSAKEPQPELLRAVKGKAVVVVGDRGCGKTTLIQGMLREQGGKTEPGGSVAGTHTAYLQAGTEGTLFIDTPGFRDFALPEITREERMAVFPEIDTLAGKCFFADCTHIHEDGCRVREGLREKRINRERYDAYQKMAGKTGKALAKIKRPGADYRSEPCMESFICQVCGKPSGPEGAGSMHRNHCPGCLSSIHVDIEPGDRASLCRGIMDPVSVWVRRNGEWAVIHRCRLCGALSSNRIAADDNPAMLMSIAVKPLAMPPFPLSRLGEEIRDTEH